MYRENLLIDLWAFMNGRPPGPPSLMDQSESLLTEITSTPSPFRGLLLSVSLLLISFGWDWITEVHHASNFEMESDVT